MGIQFNADEVFRIAEQMERNGAEYYRRAAQAAEDAQLRSKFGELAAMEEAHEKTFQELHSLLKSAEKQQTVFDPNEEAALYLQAMADGFAIEQKGTPEELLAGKSLKEILKTAIGLEKDAIIFYLGLRDFVPEGAGKDKVDWIINQERGHIVALSGQLKSL